MIRRVGLVRGVGAAAAVLLMLLPGCGRPPADPGPLPGATGTAPETGPSTPASPTAGSAPSSPDEDASFGFDDVASYEGSVEVEIAGTQGRRTTGMTGAEATRGEIVVVSVLLRNLSSVDLDASTVLVTTSYGRDDREAALVTDPTGTLTGGFLGSLTPGAEDTVDLGFAVPFAAQGQVRVTVDLGDDVHAPVTFTGAVERVQ